MAHLFGHEMRYVCKPPKSAAAYRSRGVRFWEAARHRGAAWIEREAADQGVLNPDRGFRLRLRISEMNEDMGGCSGKGVGCRAANAARRAGNEGGFIVKVWHDRPLKMFRSKVTS
jgi:hypothetical protein